MSEESIIEKNNELIIQQMEVIQKISNNQDEIFHNIDDILTKCAETDDTLGKIQEHVGFKKTQKEKNVINEKKTPSNLSGSEKKRFESIGKAFISGAGAVFEKIRKASKFKEMMSTVKNKFSKGFEAFNKGVSKVKKKATFLGKLLLIIGLMGTIVYLFKDKIVKAIPDFSENIETLFENVKDFIKKSVTSIYDYVIDVIGNIFNVGFVNLVHDVLPSVIRNFFDETLPNEIEKMYLQILSGFSSSAGELYRERYQKDVERTAEAVADKAENAERGKQEPKGTEQKEQKEPILSTFARLDQAKREHASNTATIDDYNFLQQNSGLQAMDQTSFTFRPLDFLKTVNVNTSDGKVKNVRQLINEKKFDINTFLNSINKDKSGGLTSEEMKSAILSGLTHGDRNANTEDSVKIDESNFVTNEFINVANNYAHLQTTYANKVKELKEQSKKQVTELNVAEPIKDQIKVFVDNIYNHFQKFFQGDAIGKNIDDRLTEIKTEFENFFNKFYEYIEKVIENIDKVTTYANTQLPEQPTQEGEGGKPESEKGDANQSSTNTSFVARINVTPQIDISGNIVDILNKVVSDDSGTKEFVSQSNRKLEQIIEKLKQFTPVDKEYTDNEIDKNNLYLINLMSQMAVDNSITRKSLNEIYIAMAKAPTANNNYTNRVAVNQGEGQ